VHRAAASHQEDVCQTKFGEALGDIVSDAHVLFFLRLDLGLPSKPERANLCPAERLDQCDSRDEALRPPRPAPVQ
jgi:hypothetical protein